MNRLVIYGAGGFGKETAFLLKAINQTNPLFEFAGFIDDFATHDFPKATGDYQHVAIAIAAPHIRRQIYERNHGKYIFPALIHPDVTLDETVQLGIGAIICSGVKITVDIQIGKCPIFNVHATIGHDSRIGDFVSIMPAASISGKVTLGNHVFIGSNAVVLPGLTVGDNSIVGAGAVVTKDVPANHMAIGVPARFVPLPNSHE